MGAMEPCKKCHGEGVIAVTRKGERKSIGLELEEKDVLIECHCAIVKRLSFTMPGEVRMAQMLDAHADHPASTMMNKSLYISATYADMLAIIKAAIIKTQGKYYVRSTTDAEIRNVGVGSMSRKAKGEDAKDVYNSFSDLMESPPLVVVWLNKLGHKNVAAAGFLMEALMVRIDKRKPTWVVNDKDNPFGPGCFAYTEAVKAFLNMAFMRVDVPRILTFDGEPVRKEAPEPVLEVEYAPSQQAGSQKKRQKPAPKTVDDDLPDGFGSIGMGAPKGQKIRGRD